MPEVVAFLGELGAADVATTAAVGGEFITGMGAADVAASTALSAAPFAGGALSGGAAAAEVAGGAVGADVIGSAAGDATTAGTQAASQYGPAASPAELAYTGATSGNFLSNLLGTKGNLAGLFAKGGTGLGMIQTLSGIYGLEQSRKLAAMASPKGPTEAGMQAVMRSQASQGYQGSGKMAAELQKYGIDAATPSAAQIGAGEAGLVGSMGSLGLLTSGLPSLPGWLGGGAAAPIPGG